MNFMNQDPNQRRGRLFGGTLRDAFGRSPMQSNQGMIPETMPAPIQQPRPVQTPMQPQMSMGGYRNSQGFGENPQLADVQDLIRRRMQAHNNAMGRPMTQVPPTQGAGFTPRLFGQPTVRKY